MDLDPKAGGHHDTEAVFRLVLESFSGNVHLAAIALGVEVESLLVWVGPAFEMATRQTDHPYQGTVRSEKHAA
ncbi:MAG: hypothetical protein AMXMBFR84_14300 [Candidatus Hydrogenedentota bacterium]